MRPPVVSTVLRRDAVTCLPKTHAEEATAVVPSP